MKNLTNRIRRFTRGNVRTLVGKRVITLVGWDVEDAIVFSMHEEIVNQIKWPVWYEIRDLSKIPLTSYS